ncbi:unnamed protein product, partial [Symbiodinium sp. KB8]
RALTLPRPLRRPGTGGERWRGGADGFYRYHVLGGLLHHAFGLQQVRGHPGCLLCLPRCPEGTRCGHGPVQEPPGHGEAAVELEARSRSVRDSVGPGRGDDQAAQGQAVVRRLSHRAA